MQNETLWPLPILPVKNRQKVAKHNFPMLGVMIPKQPIVYLTDIYSGKPLDQCEKEVYPDYDKVIAAGWIVD